jgi:hypothetical protein
MAKFIIPKVAPGTTLTQATVETFPANVSAGLATLNEENVLPHTITRREVDWGDVNQTGTNSDSQSGSSAAYSGVTPVLLTHGATDSSLVYPSGLFCPAGTIIRTHFSCLVKTTTYDATQGNDAFYFRWSYEDTLANVIVPETNLFGFSVTVSNPGGTPQTGEVHNAAAYQANALAQWSPYYRRITLSGIYQIPADVSLANIGWFYNSGHASTAITIGDYQVFATSHRA